MKIVIVIGTRPEAVKLAPVIKAAQANPAFEVKVVSTGQHKEMLLDICESLDIAIDVDLGAMREGRTLCETAAGTLEKMDVVLASIKPDWVLVQGDTSTAMAAGLAAFYNKCKVAHVEAGLRSYDSASPFPEEMHRKVISTFCDIHFAPTVLAEKNLLREGIREDKILVTGNTVIDTLMMMQKRFVEEAEKLNALHKRYPALSAEGKTVLVTIHRRENHGKGIAHICEAIRALAKTYPELHFIFPVHLNPDVKRPVYKYLENTAGVTLAPPLDYFSFLYIMNRSHFILTDSGGVQEESTGFSRPVLILRTKTERIESVEAGIARLVAPEKQSIIDNVNALLSDETAYEYMCRPVLPYGDGAASERILRALLTSVVSCKETMKCFP